MATACTCNVGLGNTGSPNCIPLMDAALFFIAVPYFRADGSVNGIDLSTLPGGKLNQTFLDEQIRNADDQERWRILPRMKNVTDERGDDITEDFDDQTSVFIQQGIRSVSALMLKQGPTLLGILEGFRCASVGLFVVDKSFNLIGNCSQDGFLNPIRVSDETWSPMLIKTTDTTKQKIQLNFQWDISEQDKDLAQIGASDITANLSNARAMIDGVVSLAVNSATQDSITLTLNTLYGDKLNPIPAAGMTNVSDWSLFNRNTLSPMAVTSVSVAGDNSYTLNFIAENIGDVVEIESGQVPGTIVSSIYNKIYDITKYSHTLTA